MSSAQLIVSLDHLMDEYVHAARLEGVCVNTDELEKFIRSMKDSQIPLSRSVRAYLIANAITHPAVLPFTHRMIESLREKVHVKSARGGRHVAISPTEDMRDVLPPSQLWQEREQWRANERVQPPLGANWAHITLVSSTALLPEPHEFMGVVLDVSASGLRIEPSVKLDMLLERLANESILIEMQLHLVGVPDAVHCFGRARRVTPRNDQLQSIGIELVDFSNPSDEVTLRLWVVHQLARQVRVRDHLPLEPHDHGAEIVDFQDDLKLLRQS